jgi:hypothetical protein
MVFFVFSSFSLAQTIESEPTANEVAISGVGDVVQLALPFAAGLSTVILGDKEGTWQFVKSFGTTVVLTYALKYAIDKPRPNPSMEGRAFHLVIQQRHFLAPRLFKEGSVGLMDCQPMLWRGLLDIRDCKAIRLRTMVGMFWPEL